MYEQQPSEGAAKRQRVDLDTDKLDPQVETQGGTEIAAMKSQLDIATRQIAELQAQIDAVSQVVSKVKISFATKHAENDRIVHSNPQQSASGSELERLESSVSQHQDGIDGKVAALTREIERYKTQDEQLKTENEQYKTNIERQRAYVVNLEDVADDALTKAEEWSKLVLEELR